jgi:nucleoside-diphosphate-sugar epimerase
MFGIRWDIRLPKLSSKGKGLKVLLTGYAGFLGRHLARALIKEGYYIRVLLHRRTVARQDFVNEAHEVVWGSLDDKEIVRRAIKGIQVVVHSAWGFSAPLAPRPTVNEIGTEFLLRESVRAGVKDFAFISSVAVYGMKSSANPVDESSSVAEGEEGDFIYPSEKRKVEEILNSFNKKKIRIGIFRPGPIFDEERGLIKKIITIAGLSLGIGIGNGRNQMAYIHADDTASAVKKWLKSDKGNLVLNVTPTRCLKHRVWYRNWGRVHRIRLKPVFVPGALVRLAAFAIKMLKRILGRESRGDVKYAIACSTRDLGYSNEFIKKSLGWSDQATAEYTREA